MIKSNDDVRYCQDVFGCLPVADIVKRRTAKFLKIYKEANDNNIVCQACIRYWLSSYHCCWLVKFLFLFIFVVLFILFIVYHLWWNKDVYIKIHVYEEKCNLKLILFTNDWWKENLRQKVNDVLTTTIELTIIKKNKLHKHVQWVKFDDSQWSSLFRQCRIENTTKLT